MSAEELQALRARVAELERWKNQVIDVAVMHWVYRAEHDADGRLCALEIAAQAVREALDPTVGTTDNAGGQQ